MAFSVGTVLRESLRRLATGPALLVLLALVVVETAVALVPSGGADLGLIGISEWRLEYQLARQLVGRILYVRNDCSSRRKEC